MWVLTGDKMETAINIGYSCSLLNTEMKTLIISSEHLEGDHESVPVTSPQTGIQALESHFRRNFPEVTLWSKQRIDEFLFSLSAAQNGGTLKRINRPLLSTYLLSFTEASLNRMSSRDLRDLNSNLNNRGAEIDQPAEGKLTLQFAPDGIGDCYNFIHSRTRGNGRGRSS